MLKCILSFAAGCLTVIAVLAVIGAVSYHRMTTVAAIQGASPTTTVTIHVAQNPEALRLPNDAQGVLDQITDLTEADKKKIRDGIASGLVTEIELRSDVGGESHSITIPVHPSGYIVRTSSSAHFGPAQLQVEDGGSPKQSPDTTGRR